MDEQREWLKRRKKKHLRILSMVLCFCILFTACPDIIATLSALAEEEGETEDILHISGFMELPMEIREQTVPVGTEWNELLLPDTLEVVVNISGGKEPTEDTGENPEGTRPGGTEGTETQPGGTEGTETQPGGTEGTGTQPGETDGTETQPDGTEGTEIESGGG